MMGIFGKSAIRVELVMHKYVVLNHWFILRLYAVDLDSLTFIFFDHNVESVGQK